MSGRFFALLITLSWGCAGEAPADRKPAREPTATERLARLSGPREQDRGFALQKADLEGQDLSGADAAYAQLQGSRLDGAKLDLANIAKSDLSGASLRGASLVRTNVSRIVARDADFSNARLEGANLVGADLQGAHFEGATLRNAYLTFADLQGATGLTPAQLREAQWAAGNPPLVDPLLAGVIEEQRPAGTGSGRRGPDLAAATLVGQNLESTNLRGSDLTEADLSGANLRGADLTGATLAGTNLTGADMRGARGLTAAALRQTRWDPQRPPRLDDALAAELNPESAAAPLPIDELFARTLVIDGVLSPYRKLDPQCPRECRSEPVPPAEMKSLTGVDIGVLNIAAATVEKVRRVASGFRERGGQIILDAADFRRVAASDDYGAVLYVQQVPLIDGDPTRVQEWFDAGVRIIQPAYSGNIPAPDLRAANKLGGGADEPGQGLTELGRAVVRELAARSMIIDVSHCSQKTTFDIIQMTDVAIMANHANAKALTFSVRGPAVLGRNKSDRELLAIAETGGVIGVNIVGWMLDTDGDSIGTIDDFLAHVDYLVQLVGIDHVGIASDARVDGWGLKEIHYADDALARPDRWKLVARRLRDEYGYTDGQLKKILGGNFQRMFEQGLPGGGTQ